MLIIPAEHPLDWKRPPVTTLLLASATRADPDWMKTYDLALWRRLSQMPQPLQQLPPLTLQLAKQLGQRRDLRAVSELAQYLRKAFPEAEQTQQLSFYQQNLALSP